MKLDIESQSATKKKLKFEVPADKVNKAYEDATKKIGAKATIKGFRPGKVPPSVLNQYYAQDIELESLNLVVGESYSFALNEHGFSPISDPHFQFGKLARNSPFTFEAEIEIKPQFELKKYLEIPIKKKVAEVKDEEVKAELERLQNIHATLKPVDENQVFGPGFVGVIDAKGTIDGTPSPDLTTVGFQAEFGKNILLEDIEKQIKGLKKNETKKVELTFPETHPNPNLKGKKAEVEVTLKDLHQKVLPNLDDDFAKDIEKGSLDQLKKEITDTLIKHKEHHFRETYANDVVEYLIKEHPLEIPQGLVAEEMKLANKKEEEVIRNYRAIFILEEISKKEGLRVEPKEFESRLQYISSVSRMPLDKVREHYKDQGRFRQLLSQILFEKALDFLIDRAKFI